jgi:hypothetical protein
MNSIEVYTQILTDTVTYYSEDTSRRSFDRNGNPQYLSEDGRMCSVGRYLEVFPPKELMSKPAMVLSEPTVKFKEGARGLDSNFWNRLQNLHDDSKFWNVKSGLSHEGLHEANRIYSKINSGGFRDIE